MDPLTLAAVGTVASSIGNFFSSRSASKAQKAAAQQQLALYQGLQTEATNSTQPYTDLGKSAISPLTNLLGLDGNAPDYSKFYDSPGYQFRLKEGIKGLDRSAATRGRLLSGAQLKGVTRFAEDNASTAYDSYLNRLHSLINVGQSATGQKLSTLSGALSGQSNALGSIGNANASMANQYSELGNGVLSGLTNWYYGSMNNPSTPNNVTSMVGTAGGTLPGGGQTYWGTPRPIQ